jgi:hypothetical protein
MSATIDLEGESTEEALLGALFDVTNPMKVSVHASESWDGTQLLLRTDSRGARPDGSEASRPRVRTNGSTPRGMVPAGQRRTAQAESDGVRDAPPTAHKAEREA